MSSQEGVALFCPPPFRLRSSYGATSRRVAGKREEIFWDAYPG